MVFVSLKKHLKVKYLRSFWLFFNFSLLIWVSLLKLHIPWKFGLHPFILHENRLFEHDFHTYWVVQNNSVFCFYLSFVWKIIFGGGGTSSENIDPIWAFKKYIRSQISNFDFSPVSRTVHLNSRLKSRTRLDCRHFEFRNNK